MGVETIYSWLVQFITDGTKVCAWLVEGLRIETPYGTFYPLALLSIGGLIVFIAIAVVKWGVS